MRGGRIRNPLERALMVAAVLVGLAVTLWLFAMIVSWWSECPAGGGFQPMGLDKGGSVWPPGASCYAEGRGHGGNDLVAYEAIPSLKWIILGLGVTAMATLIAGLAASIAVLRSRPEVGRS
jgi:hypothetical protein